MKIQVHADCNNESRKLIIRDFNVAFAKGKRSIIINSVSPDINWTVYGDFELTGKKAFEQEIDKMLKYPRPKELIIDSIISHGAESLANGIIVMEDNSYAFCDVYKFVNAKSEMLKEIKSYVIEI